MCGEMASDPRYTRLLLAMGLENFSMHPNAILEIKRVINETNLALLPEDTLQMMNLATPLDADLLLEKINNSH
jgi:phosphotransferase system enzyme I (PtsI)